VANKNSVAITTLANEIFTVLKKIFVKFQTSVFEKMFSRQDVIFKTEHKDGSF
jgi:hypothetical protein